MKTNEALSLLNIKTQSITLDDVKKAYRKACKAYHPDVNPSGEMMMKMINDAYESLCRLDYPLLFSEQKDTNANYGVDVKNALDAIVEVLKSTNILTEVCGSWIWISGETKSHKDILKAAGFKYAFKKKQWFFRPESESGKKWRRGSYSMDDIRSKYGSSRPSFTQNRAIA
jgi:curved DNA-binding protein CbpA